MELLDRRSCRFTPTPVGNMCTKIPKRRYGPVHPHACGEYLTPYHSALAVVGSPPRLWGISQDELLEKEMDAVHPHACGEYFDSLGKNRFFFGSPPRLWGILAAKELNTPSWAVHPHACGEYDVGEY